MWPYFSIAVLKQSWEFVCVRDEKGCLDSSIGPLTSFSVFVLQQSVSLLVAGQVYELLCFGAWSRLLFITFTCCMYVISISRTRAANLLTIGRTCLNVVQALSKHALATQALFVLPYPTWFKLTLYDLLGFQTPNSPDNPLFSSYSDLLCISQKPYRSQVIEEPGEWRR